MRAELPWTVAGIPPEAREAARAAARREGLSVGEWLTRRILRGFPDMEEELSSANDRAPTGAPLDSWGLPPSAASRHNTEELIARVDRSESESNEAWRRIDDQLRGLGRRVETSERSQGENSRRLSVSAREQAQAFDQLGANVMSLNQRLQRLERTSSDAGMKDAVKALHLGLSRLAEQIATTARNSAAQVNQLNGNLQHLAGHVGQVQSEAADNHKQLSARTDAADERIAAAEQIIDRNRESLEQFQQKLEATEHRFATNEEALQRNTDALNLASQKADEAAAQRSADLAENKRHAAQTAESLDRLEDSLARLETRPPDAALERRLDSIEHSVSTVVERIENFDPRAQFDAALLALSHRLESLEKDHTDLVGEMRAKLQPQEPPAFDIPEPASEAVVVPHFADQAPEYHDAFQHGFAQEPFTPQDAFGEPVAEQSGYGAEGADAFAPEQTPPETPGGFTFDIPPDAAPEHEKEASAPAPEFGAEFESIFTKLDAEQDNFLTQARRSARAASDQAETERLGRIGNFRWGQGEEQETAENSEGAEKKRSRLVIPLVLALVTAVAVLAGLMLLQRSTPVVTPPKPATVVVPATPAPKPAETISPSLVVKPPPPGIAHDTTAQDAPRPSAAAPASATSAPAPSAPTASPAPVPPRDARPAPVKPQPSAAAPSTAAPSVATPTSAKPPIKPQASRNTPSTERVMQQANAGNPVALTILGLRALDGTNGSPVNLPDAARFLTLAADKGQPVAQYRLGTMYERGQGVPADGAKASRLYEASANQGNRKAMHNLAVSYAGRRNMAEAARWFAKAAALGLSDSQFNLAVLYERGEGVPLSLSDAYKWYSIAAAAGDSESKTRIAVLQTQLSDADRATAGKSAAAFRAAQLNRIANVPPEPADLG